jgi:uncharacterized membrane protein HdeD (DUF308 family)
MVRAIPAAALALAVTFSADHSSRFGLIAFGIFAVVTGFAIGVLSWVRLRSSGSRSYLVTQAVITLVAGILALLFRDGGIAVLFLVFTVFSAITGFLELYLGLRSRRRFAASTDWLSVGAITAVAAVVFVLIPPDYRQPFEGAEEVSGVIDSSVIAVGLLGAYAAIIAVYLLIAAFSARWGTQRAAVAAESEKVA